MELIFATNNQNKVDEIKSALTGDLQILTLKEIGIDIDIPEPYETLEENAFEKSSVINKLTSKNCFSEDTGLFTDALNGQPGVKSARYAGVEANNEKNISLLLRNLNGISNRTAYFKTVISLILNGKEYQFSGVCNGTILTKKKGEKGFGYDAVFVPDGEAKTFAEMDFIEKNKYSHRKKALEKLIDFLNNYNGKN